jgi:hypothetical protein
MFGLLKMFKKKKIEKIQNKNKRKKETEPKSHMPRGK